MAPEITQDCLKCIPLGKDAAIELVDSMAPYLRWQSDSAYKANPTADYPFPGRLYVKFLSGNCIADVVRKGYDIFANLANFKADLQADKYESEYSFQLDLYLNLIAKGHDVHLLFYPDALARVFSFERPQPLVSISEDGVHLPVIKFYGRPPVFVQYVTLADIGNPNFKNRGCCFQFGDRGHRHAH